MQCSVSFRGVKRVQQGRSGGRRQVQGADIRREGQDRQNCRPARRPSNDSFPCRRTRSWNRRLRLRASRRSREDEEGQDGAAGRRMRRTQERHGRLRRQLHRSGKEEERKEVAERFRACAAWSRGRRPDGCDAGKRRQTVSKTARQPTDAGRWRQTATTRCQRQIGWRAFPSRQKIYQCVEKVLQTKRSRISNVFFLQATASPRIAQVFAVLFYTCVETPLPPGLPPAPDARCVPVAIH